MPELPGLWSLSPLAALVGFIVLLGYFLATGKLVTRREVDKLMAQTEAGHGLLRAQWDQRLQDYKDREGTLVKRGDDWKDAYQTERTAGDETRAQVTALTEGGRATQHLVESIARPPHGGQSVPVETS